MVEIGQALKDIALLLRPLSKKEQFDFKKLEPYLTEKERKLATKLIKQKKAEIAIEKKDISFLISGKNLLPRLKSDFLEVKQLNQSVRQSYYRTLFEDFSKRAWDALPHFIAPNVIGLLNEKKATLLQLFSPERLHILLLGDPGTGKTEVLRSASELAPKSSFGLGSGTSGVGLSVTVKGKKVLPGLLPMAHQGITYIDELNLMKKQDRASLYNAMEKGFVTYDKGGEHYKFDANINILATANPKDDKFEKYTKAQIKKQLPFDLALLSRFHLMFIVKQASLDTFESIAEKIISGTEENIKTGDIEFIREYIIQARDLEVEIPKHLMLMIKNFVVDVKKREKNLPYEITPRLVHGVIEMAKASARLELRDKIENKDLARVFEIVESTLAFKD